MPSSYSTAVAVESHPDAVGDGLVDTSRPKEGLH